MSHHSLQVIGDARKECLEPVNLQVWNTRKPHSKLYLIFHDYSKLKLSCKLQSVQIVFVFNSLVRKYRQTKNIKKIIREFCNSA